MPHLEHIRWGLLRAVVGGIVGFIVCLALNEATSVPLVAMGRVSTNDYSGGVILAAIMGLPVGMAIWGFRTKPKRAVKITCASSALVVVCIAVAQVLINMRYSHPLTADTVLFYAFSFALISTVGGVTAYLVALVYHKFGASLNPPPPIPKPRGEHRYGETRPPFEL